ncbi:mitochondrial sodium/calcium exchanger protein-like [Halichondria panicea]|uniref:mitochondrial sodium/calcium exchanger protein-like n=1 Tax=Halichondria panicea TaxID=6063 RepID=UPI00312B629E
MPGSIECGIPVRQLRGYVCMVTFTCFFLYLLSGVYHVPSASPASGRLGRQLLSTPSDEEGGNASNDSCNDNGLIMEDLPVDLASAHCSDLHDLSSNSSACVFVTCVESCGSEEGIIDYLNFIYCQMPFNLIPLAMVILFVWLIFLFVVLGATAEEYFCPALTVMSQVLRLNQNIAGVTLLAFGNGAPDIFSAISAINQPDDEKASLAVGALFGAGIFVTTVVVGAVTITKPFSLTQRPFLRDIIFYMSAVFWTFYLLWTNYVSIFHAVGFISMYIVYVVVVIVGRFSYQRYKKWRNIKRAGTGDIPTAPALPEGKELDSSSASAKRSTSMFSHLPSPDIGGSIQTSSEDVEEIKRERDDPKNFQIPSLSVSESSGVIGHGIQIQVIDEDDEEEEINENTKLLIRPGKARERDMTGSLPSGFHAGGESLAPPTSRRRGASVEAPTDEYSYGAVVRPAAYGRPKKMRKTLSGALDITEEVGAAVGIPHLSQVWEEVHRSHSRSRSASMLSERPEETEKEPLLAEDSSDEDEQNPLVNLKIRRRHPFIKMLLALWPFGESFKELGILGKIYEVFKSPASFFLSLTVPMVDRNEDDHNWNKWLNVVHCVTSPMFVILIIKYRFYLIGDVFPVAGIVLVFSLICAIIVALTSKNEKPPIYHCIYAWVGFVVAVVWIYSTVNEIVNLLQAFGLVVHLSEGILGLTLLAWGNSIGDAVSNVTMAKQGFPRMAIGACFGGPLLNILLGIGLGSIIKSLGREGFAFKLYFTQVELLASLFLLLSLSCSLVVLFILKFRLKRAYGVFLILIYVTFLTVAILAEAKVFQIVIPGVITVA